MTAAREPLRGRFITFEGIDGCGKSTQADTLADRLREAGLPVLKTREPGGTPIGARLREVLLNPEHTAMAPVCELLLYLADRVQHLEETIRPALARGEVVVCDRFHDATVAYQQHGRGLDFAPLAPFIERHVLNPPPDCTFWLDVDVATARGRLPLQGRDRLEQAEDAFHERVRAGYAAQAAAEPQRVIRIDGAREEEPIAREIMAMIEERYDVR